MGILTKHISSTLQCLLTMSRCRKKVAWKALQNAKGLLSLTLQISRPDDKVSKLTLMWYLAMKWIHVRTKDIYVPWKIQCFLFTISTIMLQKWFIIEYPACLPFESQKLGKVSEAFCKKWCFSLRITTRGEIITFSFTVFARHKVLYVNISRC